MKLLPLIALLALCGCHEDARRQRIDLQIKSDSRFEITRISAFKDDLAYDSWRGVYLIKDAKTGREYVGVSGIGISEIASHPMGKGQTAEDER